MKCAVLIRGLVATVVLTAAVGLASCGGGGGGGSGDISDAIVTSISVQGVAAPIYTNGQPPLPVPPTGVFLNARITFRFGAAVDPASIPSDGPANGSIRITAGVAGAPAVGTWAVDPADARAIFFNPLPPTAPSAGCTAGLQSTTGYVIDVPDTTGGNQQVLRFAGTPIQAPANSQFQTVLCSLANPSAAFTDAVAGPPTIVSTTPVASAAAPTVTQAAIEGNPGQSVVTVFVSEPLQPSSVTINNFRLLNVTANPSTTFPVVAVVTFAQTGTFASGAGQQSRVQITTLAPLPDGDVFELAFSNVVDLGNNPLTVAPGSLRFTVQADPSNDVTSVFTDDFATTTFRGSTSGAIQWTGNGFVQATFPQDIVGTGTDGSPTITANMNINTNLNNGIFNFVALTVGTGSPVTLNYQSVSNDPLLATSNFSVQLRSQTTITVNTGASLLCNGRTGAGGMQNSALTPELGGWGGPGGGNGGTASPSTSTTVPSLFGLPGEGAKSDINNPNVPGGASNTNGSSVLFGGGGSGNSGPATTFGPSGGGGGTASMMPPRGAAGEPQQGNNQAGGGAPLPGLGGPVPPAMIPPLLQPIGGSGGAGGGDRLDAGAVANHDTGGAGGGGGGALRLSAGQNITLAQTSAFNCSGGNGGSAQNLLTAKGGGGSGGSVLIQTFTNISLGLGVQFLCGGGAPSGGTPTPVNPPAMPPDGDGGAGGQGVIQLEDSDNMYPNLSSALSIGEVFTRLFQFTGNVVGQARSIFIDSGSASTDYLVASSILSNGATGGANVMVVGVAEDPANPGNPAINTPALISAPVPLTSIGAINGYRYFQYQMNTTFPAPPTTILGQALPEITDFSVQFRR